MKKTQPCCAPDGCCDEAPTTKTPSPDIRDAVREGYSRVARTGSLSGATREMLAETPDSGSACGCSDGGCCGPVTLSPDQVARAVGYAAAELDALPDGANMGLSCGNPTALASLTPGEVVVDLGSGGGFDCFIAGPRVGATGLAIGIDMTPDMLTKARRNLDAYRERSGLDNVEFRLGEIENLPVADNTADVVISNCVLNLSPDKPRVWREIARVLKPGGRAAISDLALLRPLPEPVRHDLESLIGCIAGADLIEDIERDIRAAGLTDIELVSKPGYVAAMTDSNDPLYQKIQQALPEGAIAADFATSLEIIARKPEAG